MEVKTNVIEILKKEGLYIKEPHNIRILRKALENNTHIPLKLKLEFKEAWASYANAQYLRESDFLEMATWLCIIFGSLLGIALALLCLLSNFYGVYKMMIFGIGPVCVWVPLLIFLTYYRRLKCKEVEKWGRIQEILKIIQIP